ncbi:CGNR zinc finger domain-containing protein [Staphylococcus cohnii]|uniref:CGNR zinc finger domain-containing protein n=1 Tax=Staphylococcus cohnii TaxID=29382 RepID=UPI00254A0678|nr:CGNR zinc finger domain-containing protein [Staphylococcus cohnii]WIL69801.1 CGNR zinc finger domain-containing protein [Staphylococcus cohnii]
MDKKILTIGGKPWINLVNTIFIKDNKKIDLFISKSDILNWLIENNIVNQNTNENVITDELVTLLKKLRRLSKEVLISIQSEGELSQNIKSKIKKYINDTNITVNFLDDDKNIDLIYIGKTIKDNITYIIINDLINTLKHYDTRRIRQCHHENCICYFLDISKAGKRKWCDMETCGNRKKASNYYQKYKH